MSGSYRINGSGMKFVLCDKMTARASVGSYRVATYKQYPKAATGYRIALPINRDRFEADRMAQPSGHPPGPDPG